MADEKPKTEEKPAEEKPAATTPAVETPAAGAAAGTPAAAAPAGTTALSRPEQVKQFTDAFGAEHGITLFAKHETVAAAQAEYNQILRTENESLKKELAKFAKPAQGEQAASFGGQGQSEPPTKFSNLGGNLSRYAAGIKMPK